MVVAVRKRRPVALLGDLEGAVMTHLWDGGGAADVKAVYEAIGRARRITLNTVQSTMERLFRKGLLGREKVSHAYVYAPRVSRAEFGARLMHDVAREVFGGTVEPLLAAFVDLTARTGEADLARLERLIAARRGAGGKE
jgi:predicted transcriptional regulator